MNFNDFVNNEYADKEFDTPVGMIKIPKERNLYNALNKWYEKLAYEITGRLSTSVLRLS